MSLLARILPELAAASPFPFALDQRRCLRLDLGSLDAATLDPADATAFSAWIEQQMAQAGADFAAGGYGEDRALYRASALFHSPDAEPRTVHLGIDLWAQAGTPVHAVLGGRVHSTRDNAAFGDYGPTVLLEHEAEGLRFYTLYGHLTRESLAHTRRGDRLRAGDPIGSLGDATVNGGWPPHLHFQVIDDLRGREGDHPGACARSQRELWLARCPDPNLLLRVPALR